MTNAKYHTEAGAGAGPKILAFSQLGSLTIPKLASWVCRAHPSFLEGGKPGLIKLVGGLHGSLWTRSVEKGTSERPPDLVCAYPPRPGDRSHLDRTGTEAGETEAGC